jgi:superfamily II DNA or RNA helicase
VAHTEGIVAASVGSGKTVLSCWLTRHFGLKTTVLVPNSVIQAQFILEFKKWFNYDVGVINGKTKEIKDVTISTFQSLSADKELCDKLAEQSAMLIVDEAHGGISTERAKILKRFKPSRLYGLSGTPRRSKDDGRTDAIFFYFGNVISSHMMPQVKPTVEVIRTGAKIPVTANYHEMVDYVVENESRNKLIVGLAVGEAMEGKRVLILVKRVDHCKRLKELLPDWGVLVFHADGEDKTRNETLMAMRAGEKDFRILIGTFSLLVAGLDIPSLDRLIIGADCKSDVMVAQGTGRILRLFEGKESAKIYDLFDNLNPIFKNQFYERKRFYDSQKWEIKM